MLLPGTNAIFLMETSIVVVLSEGSKYKVKRAQLLSSLFLKKANRRFPYKSVSL